MSADGVSCAGGGGEAEAVVGRVASLRERRVAELFGASRVKRGPGDAKDLDTESDSELDDSTMCPTATDRTECSVRSRGSRIFSGDAGGCGEELTSGPGPELGGLEGADEPPDAPSEVTGNEVSQMHSVLEEEILWWSRCAELRMIAAACRAFSRRLDGRFWRRRFSALPAEVLREADLHLPADGGEDAPTAAEAWPAWLHPQRLAALEARAQLLVDERADLDHGLCVAAHQGRPCWPWLHRGAAAQAAAGGRPALCFAAHRGSLPTVQTLIRCAADLEAADRDGDRPLVAGIVSRHVEVVAALLTARACTEALDCHGDRPLITAVVSGQAAMVSTLLRGRADAEALDADGDTPLICAVLNGSVECVRALLRGRADVSGRDEHGGDSALLRAHHSGHPSVVEALFAAGADIGCPSQRNRAATEVAKEAGNHEIVRMLKDHPHAIASASEYA